MKQGRLMKLVAMAALLALAAIPLVLASSKREPVRVTRYPDNIFEDELSL